MTKLRTLVEDRTWPVLAWRQRKHQSRLEPVTLVDLPDPREDFHRCVLTHEDVVIDRTGKELRNVAEWRWEILRHAAGIELARNALGETVDQVIEATVMT